MKPNASDRYDSGVARATPPDSAEPNGDNGVKDFDDATLNYENYRPVGELDFVWALVKRGLLLAVAVFVISLSAPGLFDELLRLLSRADRLRNIRPWWFVVMIIAEIFSFASLWWLTRILLPRVSWFVAATSQLTSNSVSRVVPGGGAAAGGATLYRMLAVSGTNPTQAGGALAAQSLLSTAALAAIPAIGLTIALFGAPIPEALAPGVFASGVLCVLLLGVGAVALRTTRPLVFVSRVFDKVLRLAGRLFRQDWKVEPDNVVRERNRLSELLGRRWPQATAASALNWTFDYLVLVFALYAVDAQPRLSLVMVAYAAGAVLSMIPITPGGFGFVEVGLSSILVLSGIPLDSANIAVLAYRGVSLWLPIASGLPAWILFRRRYPRRSGARPTRSSRERRKLGATQPTQPGPRTP